MTQPGAVAPGQPPRNSGRQVLSPVPRVLLIAASLVVLMAGFRAAGAIILPLALAFFLATLSLPLQRFLRRSHVPPALAVGLTVLVTVSLLAFIGIIVANSFSEFVAVLPGYLRRLQELLSSVVASLVERRILPPETEAGDMINPLAVADFARALFTRAASLLSNAVLILIILIFTLAEISGFPRKIRAVLGESNADLGRFAKLILQVQRYLGIKTLVSALTGLLVGFWVWMLGIDFPLLWGLLAFLFNFIPVIGSIVASVPATILALVDFGTPRALAVVGGYFGINMLIGNLIEPQILGRSLGLSPLVVVLSLILWGWLLGPIGMFLSVPLTVIVKLSFENSRDFGWVATILGRSPPEAAREESDELSSLLERTAASEAKS